MINIEKLETLALFAQAEHAKWEAAGKPWPRPNVALLEMLSATSPLGMLELIAEIQQLREENQALRKDAERYRWVRFKHNDQSSDIALESDSRGLVEEIYDVSPDCMDLDAAVDAAIAQEKP